MADSISTLQQQIEVESNDLVALQQLEREAEAAGQIYGYFLGRMKETSVQQGIQQPDARLLSPAIAPFVASYPRKTLIVLAVGIAAGVLVSLLILVLDQFKTTFRTVEDLESYTGKTVMGVIPQLRGARRRRSVLRYFIEKPASAVAEAVRNLRTSILMTNIDAAPKVIMVTSSMPGEGKTTTTMALAQTSAGMGKRVLVIECDLRRPQFRNYAEFPHHRGLMAILSGAHDYDDVAFHDPEMGLDLIQGDQSKVNAADVFSSERFAQFMEEVREHYDFVFIDTPPVLAVPDARMLSRHSDALLYVVRWNRTHQEMVRAGLALFDQIGARVSGLAMTQADPKRITRYGSYGYGYGANTKKVQGYYVN